MPPFNNATTSKCWFHHPLYLPASESCHLLSPAEFKKKKKATGCNRVSSRIHHPACFARRSSENRLGELRVAQMPLGPTRAARRFPSCPKPASSQEGRLSRARAATSGTMAPVWMPSRVTPRIPKGTRKTQPNGKKKRHWVDWVARCFPGHPLLFGFSKGNNPLFEISGLYNSHPIPQHKQVLRSFVVCTSAALCPEGRVCT